MMSGIPIREIRLLGQKLHFVQNQRKALQEKDFAMKTHVDSPWTSASSFPEFQTLDFWKESKAL